VFKASNFQSNNDCGSHRACQNVLVQKSGVSIVSVDRPMYQIIMLMHDQGDLFSSSAGPNDA
jgi:hypothetical protein